MRSSGGGSNFANSCGACRGVGIAGFFANLALPEPGVKEQVIAELDRRFYTENAFQGLDRAQLEAKVQSWGVAMSDGTRDSIAGYIWERLHQTSGTRPVLWS